MNSFLFMDAYCQIDGYLSKYKVSLNDRKKKTSDWAAIRINYQGSSLSYSEKVVHRNIGDKVPMDELQGIEKQCRPSCYFEVPITYGSLNAKE